MPLTNLPRTAQRPLPLEKIAEYKVSFSEDYDAAFESAKFWRASELKDIFNSAITDPQSSKKKQNNKSPTKNSKSLSIQIVTSIEDCIESIEQYFHAVFTRVYVHGSDPNKIKFIQSFSSSVLPHFNEAGRATTAASL